MANHFIQSSAGSRDLWPCIIHQDGATRDFLSSSASSSSSSSFSSSSSTEVEEEEEAEEPERNETNGGRLPGGVAAGDGATNTTTSTATAVQSNIGTGNGAQWRRQNLTEEREPKSKLKGTYVRTRYW